jgi:hypothetical protein
MPIAIKLLRYGALLLVLLGAAGAAALYRYERQQQAFLAASAHNRATLPPADSTEVLVLGTVHFPTPAFNADSLYDALETLRPDLILFEIDSARLAQVLGPPPLAQRLGRALGWEATPNEAAAVLKYQHRHPAALVRPYEWGQRDQFHRQHGILSTPGLVFSKLKTLREAGHLTPRQQRVLATYDSLTARLNALGSTRPLAALNSAAADSLAQRRQNSQYHQLKTIVDENEELREFRAFYKVNERYWDIRNRAMARNIARCMVLYPGRRLVVLCGFNHRYYLLHELRPQQAALSAELSDSLALTTAKATR